MIWASEGILSKAKGKQARKECPVNAESNKITLGSGGESQLLERNIFSPECHFPFNFVLSFKDPNASAERKALQGMTFGREPTWDTTRGCKCWSVWQL